MTRDRDLLRRNLGSVLPTLSMPEVGLLLEQIGYELLARQRPEAWATLAAAREVLGWHSSTPTLPPVIRSEDCRDYLTR